MHKTISLTLFSILFIVLSCAEIPEQDEKKENSLVKTIKTVVIHGEIQTSQLPCLILKERKKEKAVAIVPIGRTVLKKVSFETK